MNVIRVGAKDLSASDLESLMRLTGGRVSAGGVYPMDTVTIKSSTGMSLTWEVNSQNVTFDYKLLGETDEDYLNAARQVSLMIYLCTHYGGAKFAGTEFPIMQHWTYEMWAERGWFHQTSQGLARFRVAEEIGHGRLAPSWWY